MGQLLYLLCLSMPFGPTDRALFRTSRIAPSDTLSGVSVPLLVTLVLSIVSLSPSLSPARPTIANWLSP